MIPKIEDSLCTGCGVCERFCPVGAIKIVDGKAVINEDLCTNCGICIERCPFGAIYYEEEIPVAGKEEGEPTSTYQIPNIGMGYGMGFGPGRGLGRGLRWGRRHGGRGLGRGMGRGRGLGRGKRRIG